MKMQERECSNQGETLGMGFDSLKNMEVINEYYDGRDNLIDPIAAAEEK